MDVDWTHELVDQLEFHWSGVFRPRLGGLTDDQYLWEPVPAMWSIRPRAEATAPMAVGAGDFVIDFSLPEPEPPPMTTIAWRMGHLSIGVFGGRASNHFGDGSVDYQTTDWPLTATAGLALLDHHPRRLAGRHPQSRRGRAGPAVRAGGRPLRRLSDGRARPAHQPGGPAPRRRATSRSRAAGSTPVTCAPAG